MKKEKSFCGTLPDSEEIRQASNNGIIDGICEYAKVIAEKDWHYIWFKPFSFYTHKCPICSQRPEGKRFGSNCICIPFACWHHGGKIPCKCNTHVINDSNWNKIAYLPSDDEVLSIAQRRIGVKELMIIRGDDVQASLKRGDVCAHFKDGKYIHSSLYLGDGMMVDCSLEKMRTAIRPAMEAKFAIRYTGGRDYLTVGDSGVAVEKVQSFLNWYFSDAEGYTPLKTDGKYDQLCEKAVSQFQSEKHKVADGKVGEKTLDAMRTE
jgi:hypothetical protein